MLYKINIDITFNLIIHINRKYLNDKIIIKKAPSVGLEPTTTGLKGLRSTI